MTQYKIQVGSWTKLPKGQVQGDTRDIMEMMAEVCNVNLETHIATTDEDWIHLGVLDAFHSVFSIQGGEPHVVLYDVNGGLYHIGHEPNLFIPYEELQKMLNAPEPVDEMVDICGVEYSAKELSEALALIKAARK